MKITDLRAQVVSAGKLFEMTGYPTPIQREGVLVRILTDQGIEGNSLTWVPRHPAKVLAEAILALKPMVIHQDPLEIERLWQQNFDATRQTLTIMAPGAIDWALWDIAGKVANLPLYRLLGAYRHRIKAYASTHVYPTVEAYVEAALELKAQGFSAIKLHPWGNPQRDVNLCQAVRKAMGDSFLLMIDCLGLYDRRSALWVGQVLEELDFYWYEEPLPDWDLEGYVELCRTLRIPIAGVDAMRFSLGTYAQYIARGAFDIVRGDAGRHGITMTRKLAAIAESFGLNFEPHGYAFALGQVANLHLSGAIRNCDFFEMPVPIGTMDMGMKEGIRLEPDGWVSLPQKPGLGLEIDWEAMSHFTQNSD